jgi:tRNA A-37 threonylcarbamoyl transferase component Bud32
MPSSQCPTREQLQHYVFGSLPDQDAERIATHVGTCPACDRILEELEGEPDRLLADLRRANPLNQYEAEPACQRARRRVLEAGRSSSGQAAPSAAKPDDSGPGKRMLGNYEILEEVGRGGMGTVYKARHTKLDKVVAIKMLPANRVQDPEAVERFQREMQALGRLEHANIVRALDAGEADGSHFLAMEYIEGVNLHELVARHGALPIADACELARQAALGLQYAHEHDRVHRDIKPSNLLLTPAGEVKILDLGLALLRTAAASGPEMTANGQTVGTADYIAPEQIGDSHAVDIRADIYSLGCTLYQLLTGRVPFGSPQYEARSDKMRAHLHGQFPPVAESRRGIPAGLASILNRMVARKPDERFAAPGDVAKALAAFTSGADLAALASMEPGQLHDGGPVLPAARRPGRRLRALLAVAAVLLFVLLGGTLAVQRFGLPWRHGSQQVAEAAGQPVAPVEAAQGTAPADPPGSQAVAPPASTNPGKPDLPPAANNGHPKPDTSPSEAVLVSVSSAAKPSDDDGFAVRNERAPFTVHVDVDHKDRIYRGPPAGLDKRGDVMRVTVKSSQAGYLYVLYRAADGKLSCLFPNRIQNDNKIPAETEIEVPAPNAKFRLRVVPPYGKETLKAVVTLVPLERKEFEVQSLTQADFTPLQPAVVKAVLVELKEKPANWAEDQVEVTTVPGEKSGS